jgi:hypothetical protein
MPEREGKWPTLFKMPRLTAGTLFDSRKVTMIDPEPGFIGCNGPAPGTDQIMGSKAGANAGDSVGVTPPTPNGTSGRGMTAQ